MRSNLLNKLTMTKKIKCKPLKSIVNIPYRASVQRREEELKRQLG